MIAHRGARAFAPENTLEAFAKAHEFGCTMIELDVHVSRDSELVVHHDDDLIRCTDALRKLPGRSSYQIADFTCAELRSLDAGSWFAGQLVLPPASRQPFLQSLSDGERERFVSPHDLAQYASGAVHLPTLREVLALARDRRMLVNIELKALRRAAPDMPRLTLQLVEAMHMTGAVLISSFDPEQLLEVRRLSSEIATALLTDDRLVRPANDLQRLDADALHPGDVQKLVAAGISLAGLPELEHVRTLRALGRAVNVWTCNDAAIMRTLVAAGVTGLITDYPNRARDVLAEL